MEALKIGILGTGVIAATLADTMNRMPGVELYGAASRSLRKRRILESGLALNAHTVLTRNLLQIRK